MHKDTVSCKMRKDAPYQAALHRDIYIPLVCVRGSGQITASTHRVQFFLNTSHNQFLTMTELSLNFCDIARGSLLCSAPGKKDSVSSWGLGGTPRKEKHHGHITVQQEGKMEANCPSGAHGVVPTLSLNSNSPDFVLSCCNLMLHPATV